MTTQDVTPIKAQGEPGDKVEALRLDHQLRQVLPKRIAEVIGSELFWLAERTNLVGRRRYLDLAADVREIVATLPVRTATEETAA